MTPSTTLRSWSEIWLPLVLVVASTATSQGTAGAQDLKQYIGLRVVPTVDCKIMNGTEEIPLDSVNIPYTIRDAVDGWLDVGPGYVEPQHLMTLEASIPYCAARIAADRNDRWAYNLRGIVRKERGDFDLAILDFNEAIRLDKSDAEVFNNRGSAYRAKGDFEKAIQDFDQAIRLDAKYATAYDNRGGAKLENGDLDGAIKDYDEAIRLDPRFAAAYHNRGFAHETKHDYAAALKDYQEAMRLDPQHPAPCDAAAWLLATCPDAKLRDGRRAVELALKSQQLGSKNDVGSLDTLAAAYAESGAFDQAAAQAARAVELAGKDHPEAAAFAARLQLYREKKPFHAE
jgi:tetratricopeptide (TPR) repeat protein